jgi:hypothetical protein
LGMEVVWSGSEKDRGDLMSGIAAASCERRRPVQGRTVIDLVIWQNSTDADAIVSPKHHIGAARRAEAFERAGSQRSAWFGRRSIVSTKFIWRAGGFSRIFLVFFARSARFAAKQKTVCPTAQPRPDLASRPWLDGCVSAGCLVRAQARPLLDHVDCFANFFFRSRAFFFFSFPGRPNLCFLFQPTQGPWRAAGAVTHTLVTSAN